MVFALLAFLPGCGGVACRAGSARRQRCNFFPTVTWRSCSPSGACTPITSGVALGTALRPGNGTTFALEAQTDQRQSMLIRSSLQSCNTAGSEPARYLVINSAYIFFVANAMAC